MKLDRKKMYKSETKLKLIFNRCFRLNFSSTSLNKCIYRTYIDLLNRIKCSPFLFMRQSWNFPLSVCRYEKACWLSLIDCSVQQDAGRARLKVWARQQQCPPWLRKGTFHDIKCNFIILDFYLYYFENILNTSYSNERVK